jgi:hypothetical protein
LEGRCRASDTADSPGFLSAATPSLGAAEIDRDDQDRPSRAIAFGHEVLGKAYGGTFTPQIWCTSDTKPPTTSIPLNPLRARGGKWSRLSYNDEVSK